MWSLRWRLAIGLFGFKIKAFHSKHQPLDHWERSGVVSRDVSSDAMQGQVRLKASERKSWCVWITLVRLKAYNSTPLKSNRTSISFGGSHKVPI